MFKKKCPSCEKKIEKKFSFCPYCGKSFKSGSGGGEDLGMLGRDDSVERVYDEINLPFGMGKIINSMVKQLEKQMEDMNFDRESVPRGFRVSISTGQPQVRQIARSGPDRRNTAPVIPAEEFERRAKLPKINAESKIRRLADRIIYEVSTPGVKSKRDIILTRVASGIEVRAYSEDKCYVKFIPLTVEIIGFHVRDDKVFVELRS